MICTIENQPQSINTIRRNWNNTVFFFFNTQEERSFEIPFRYMFRSIVLAKIPTTKFLKSFLLLFSRLFLTFLARLLSSVVLHPTFSSSVPRDHAKRVIAQRTADKTFKRDIYIYIYIRGHSLHEIAPRNCLSSYDSR